MPRLGKRARAACWRFTAERERERERDKALSVLRVAGSEEAVTNSHLTHESSGTFSRYQQSGMLLTLCFFIPPAQMTICHPNQRRGKSLICACKDSVRIIGGNCQFQPFSAGVALTNPTAESDPDGLRSGSERLRVGVPVRSRKGSGCWEFLQFLGGGEPPFDFFGKPRRTHMLWRVPTAFQTRPIVHDQRRQLHSVHSAVQECVPGQLPRCADAVGGRGLEEQSRDVVSASRRTMNTQSRRFPFNFL